MVSEKMLERFKVLKSKVDMPCGVEYRLYDCLGLTFRGSNFVAAYDYEAELFAMGYFFPSLADALECYDKLKIEGV